ncbi:hypothetical protein MASR2M70_02720 [Bacillota bacterium]
MVIEKLLPEMGKSMNKCVVFYRYDAAESLCNKNRRMIRQGYIANLLICLMCFFQIIIEISGGFKSIWDISALFLLPPGIFLMIYSSRYRAIEGRVKKAKGSIVEDLPELTDKVILLLNTGMFIEAVITKAVLEYDNNREHMGERRILYSCLKDIIKKAEETNTPLINGMSEFAVKSGVRELIRFFAIVENNFYKGSDLAEKLEGEGMMLWMGRKKLVEAKAKTAGTRLALPLMLLLAALILITSAPVLLSI